MRGCGTDARLRKRPDRLNNATFFVPLTVGFAPERRTFQGRPRPGGALRCLSWPATPPSSSGQKVGGGKDLEVAVDLGIKPGAVDDEVAGRFQGHLFDRERVAQDVLGEVFEVGLGLGRHGVSGVEVEPTVFPGVDEPVPA